MRVLIVGLGSIAQKHISALRSIQREIEIVALRSSRNANKIAYIENIYDLSEIDNMRFDFIIISNPTSEHKKTISQFIKFNIPLFIEKPLYSSLDIGEEVKNLNKQNTINYVASNLRFLDSLKLVKRFLRTTAKRINEVNVYCGSYLPDWRPDTDFRQSYSSNPDLGGGVHIDLIHELDYIYWLFGNPYQVNRKFKNQSSLNIKAFDYANYILDYDNFCINVTLNYFRRDAKRTLEIVFDDETWNIDLLKNEVYSRNIKLFSTSQRIIDTYTAQMKYFVDCIKRSQQPMNSAKEAYNVLEICLGK